MLDYGVVFEKADGLYCWDTNGKRYFDAIGGVYVAILGHRHPRIMEAMRRQMEKAVFVPPLHGTSDIGLEFVDYVGQITPGNLNFVKGFSGGSEANEAAFKFARQYFKQTGHPHKYKFISMYLSYHGATLATASASGGALRKPKIEPEVAGFIKVPNPIQLRDRFPSWELANNFCADAIAQVIENENPDTVAGIILEPICNTAGIVKPTKEFFKTVRRICDKNQVLLIFDEVLTGLAKTGKMFGAQLFDVVPDILTTGKSLSGGACPMGVMTARDSLADAFFGEPEANVHFAHGHTWGGNPLASVVGIETIKIIGEEKLDKKGAALGDYLVQKLSGLKKLGIVRDIRGSGVLRGVELVVDSETNKPFPQGAKLGSALKRTAIKNGLIMRIDPDWFAVCPPLIASEHDIDEMYDLIERSVVEALAMVKG